MKATLSALTLLLTAGGTLHAQGSPIQKGSLQLAGSASLIHGRGEDTERSYTLINVAPQFGYFVARGLSANLNLSFSRSSSSGQTVTSFGLGPGLTYFFDLRSRHFYPFVSGRTMFIWNRATPSAVLHQPTSGYWLVSGGVLLMVGEHVGITGEAFYQQQRSSGTHTYLYGLRWGVAAFVF